MLKQAQTFLKLGRVWYCSNKRYSTQTASAQDDYYKTLGVTHNATMEQIKNAYRELSKKYHPDVSKDSDAADKFKRISHAYSVLKDENSRKKYDQDHSNDYEYKGYATQKYTYQAKNNKSGEEKERAEARARERQRAGETIKSEEQVLYETIFGQSFKEDPMFFYKPENEHLRKRYEEELEKLRAKRAAETSSEQTGYKETFEDDPDWIQFMNDYRRARAGEPGSTNVGYTGGEGEPVKKSSLKLIAAGLITFGGAILYALTSEVKDLFLKMP